MPIIIQFECPNGGLLVQGLAEGDDDLEAIACSACQQIHLVNLKTGEVVVDNSD